MPACGSTLVFRSTSAIPTAPGSAARTRTPTGCCASTFQRAPTSARTAPRTLQPWRWPSTAGRERRSAGEHLPRLWTSSSNPVTQAVLRRPLESTEALSLLVSLDDEPRTNRLNDGKVGPDGAFWVGTMDDRAAKEPVAALYRVTADGKTERKITGLVVSNGLAWSGDGCMMFHSDSRACWIDRWAFDPETGHIAGRTRLRTLANEEGRP